VRRIHRTVENLRYGRDPNEPLRQGEATGARKTTVPEAYCREHTVLTPAAAEPSRSQSFLKHFIEELRNQARGKPTDLPPNPPKD
jgi:hypothetical protein